jgi:acyl-CoA reductase-like NAD-dependent aldehyde dehydrogenase
MASIKNLKKDLNYVIGDIIEAVYIWEAVNQKFDSKEAEAIIDEAIAVFDELTESINNKSVEDRAKHLKSVKADLETKAKELVDKINALK